MRFLDRSFHERVMRTMPGALEVGERLLRDRRCIRVADVRIQRSDYTDQKRSSKNQTEEPHCV